MSGIMPLRECVVCDATIWPVTDSCLCLQHMLYRRGLILDAFMRELRKEVDSGLLTDFYGRNHRLELFVPSRAPRHWDVETGDLLRVLGVRYAAAGDGGNNDEGSSAA